MTDVHVPTWTVQDRMIKARLDAGFRHPADIAAVIGVTDKTVRNWEQGKTKVPKPGLIAWSTVTRAPLWWLEGTEPPPTTENPSFTEEYAKRARVRVATLASEAA